jgi:hypothetical protein
MAEYAGYIPGKSIDWLSLAKGVKTDIDQGLKAREERKAADEKLVTDVSSKLRSWESTQNKSFNEVVLNGLDKARTQALDWNRQLKSGEITRNEYQRRMNNLNDSFDAFATTTKNFDQYVVGINKRQEEGLSSSFEMFSADLNSRLMNIGTKDMNIGDSGDFFVTDLVDGSVQNVRNYTNMNNIVDNKIDVAKTVDSVVSKWDPVVLQQLKAGGATVLTEDPRLNASYQKAKADLIGTLVNKDNPRGIVSILLDNSDLDYNLFYTADDARKVLSRAVESKEMADGKAMTSEERTKFEEKYFNENMIQVVQDNDGKYQPRITDKMISDANRVAESQIEQQLGFKKEEERGFAPSGRGGMTYTEKKDIAKKKEQLNEYQRGYVASLDAFGKDDKGNVVKTPDFSGLDDSYQYRNYKGKVYVYKMGSFDASGAQTDNAVLIKTVSEPKGLAQYTVYGKSPAESATNYERGRSQYRRAKGLSGNAKTTTNTAPNATTAPRAPR